MTAAVRLMARLAQVLVDVAAGIEPHLLRRRQRRDGRGDARACRATPVARGRPLARVDKSPRSRAASAASAGSRVSFSAGPPPPRPRPPRPAPAALPPARRRRRGPPAGNAEAPPGPARPPGQVGHGASAAAAGPAASAPAADPARGTPSSVTSAPRSSADRCQAGTPALRDRVEERLDRRVLRAGARSSPRAS